MTAESAVSRGEPVIDAGTAVSPLTLGDFFGPPDITSARISPDGTRVLCTTKSENDIGGLLIMDVASGKGASLVGRTSLDITSAYWHGNERVLFYISQNDIYSYGLYVAPANRLASHFPMRLYDVVDIVGAPAKRPDNLILWSRSVAAKYGKPGPLEEVNVRAYLDELLSLDKDEALTRKLKKTNRKDAFAPSGTIVSLGSAPDGELGVAIRIVDGELSYVYWDRDSLDWKQPADANSRMPLSRDMDPDYIWVVTEDFFAGSQFRRQNLVTGALDEPVMENLRYDLRSATPIFSSRDGKLIGIRSETERTRTRWLSEKFQNIQRSIDAILPADRDHLLINWNDAETRFVVHSTGPNHPDSFAILDTEARTLKQIGGIAPALANKPLAPATVFDFKTRDGVNIQGYLTVPPTIAPGKPGPLIILPHGGPYARDGWRFDPEVQFLVNLGYAVFQPNYRGSEGYLWSGNIASLATYGAMRDDVIDGARTLLKTGLFDPERIAIMGSSFGGYLALACSVEEPELFRCAVSVCGVFDWSDHVKSKRRSMQARPGEYALLVGAYGDPRKEKAAYEAVSPINRLDRLHIPIFIAHGNEDSIVSVAQSHRLAKELKRRKLPHETFYRPLAGHGFYSSSDRMQFYQTLRGFLAKNLVAAPAAKP